MLKDDLKEKLFKLNKTVWEDRAPWSKIEEWLSNFKHDTEQDKSERLHALYLLSQFMYFGSTEIRELLRSLYRDLCRYPAVELIRKQNSDTVDLSLINEKYSQVLRKTRFLGVGNPSESGTHLLYYFRQENKLPKDLFIHAHQVFSRYGDHASRQLKCPEVMKYVFIDDLCGSGSQASNYSDEIVRAIKDLDPTVSVAYHVLFATSSGLDEVRKNTLFDDVQAVFELERSFKCFDEESRYFTSEEEGIDKDFAKEMCITYGEMLEPDLPLGYKDGQLLIGFHHNTPDNTLPIIWFDEPEEKPWKPIFRRYPKFYGWGDGNG